MLVPQAYVPRRGDVVWITFNPQAGHEHAGRRPAVVLSPGAYNSKAGLAILCPKTPLFQELLHHLSFELVSVTFAHGRYCTLIPACSVSSFCRPL